MDINLPQKEPILQKIQHEKQLCCLPAMSKSVFSIPEKGTSKTKFYKIPATRPSQNNLKINQSKIKKENSKRSKRFKKKIFFQ